jgi:2-aminoadipate transaminase
MILEDDPYGDFWYTKNSERPYRPVASYAEVNSLYLGSFSKSMSPGLRSAYLHGPEAIVSRIELVAQGSDLAPASFDQRVILEFIRSGLLATSFNNARETYAKQHDAMLKSLEEFMPEGVIWNKPGGGFFIWLHVPDNITTVELLNAAVSREVSFIPGKMFSVNDEEPHALRLSFSKESPGRIRVGIASLATAIRFWDMKKKIPWALGDCC